MADPRHSKQNVSTGNHIIQSLDYADATARNAASLTSDDIGRVARQLDNDTFYILIDNSPLTWVVVADAVNSDVPSSRALIAGAGLTGGGTLAADRTFDVVANADGSIVVNANDIQVGVLATNTQHGNRGGGALHANATTSVAGFMSAADKTKLDNGAASYMQFGNDSVSATTTTRFLTPGYSTSIASTTTIQMPVPTAGTIKSLYVRHNGTAGNGNNIVYTVRVNSVASSLAVTLASTSSDGSDTTNTVSVAAGDKVDIQITKAASVGTSPQNVVAIFQVIP